MTSTLRRPVSPTPTVAMSATLDPSATSTSSSYRHVCILNKEDNGDVDSAKLAAAIEKKLSAAADAARTTTTANIPSHIHTLSKADKRAASQPARQTKAGRTSASPATVAHRVQQPADKPFMLHVKPKSARAHYQRQQQSVRKPLVPDEHDYRYRYELHPLCYRDAPSVRAAPKPTTTIATTTTTTWRRSGSARMQPGQAGPTLCAVGEAMQLLPSKATRTATIGRSTGVKERAAVLRPLPEEHVKELYLRAAPDFVQDKARYAHSPSAESLSAQDTLGQQQGSSSGGVDAMLSREVAALVRRVQASTGTTANNTSNKAGEQTKKEEDEVRLIQALHRASQAAAEAQQRLRRPNDTASLTCGAAAMQSALPSNVVLPMQSEGRTASEAGVPHWRLTSPHTQAQAQVQQQQQRAATARTQVHGSPYSSAALLWTGADTRRADNDDEEEAMNAWLAAQGGDYLAWTQRRPATRSTANNVTHGRAPPSRRAHSAAWPARARSASATHYGMHYTNTLPPRCKSTTRDARKHGTLYELEEEEEEEQYGTWTARSVLLRPPAQVLASASLFRDSAGASSPEEAELMSALRIVRDLLRDRCTSSKEQGSSGRLSYAARLLLSLVLYIRALGGLPTLLEARPLPADSHVVHKEDCIELLFQRNVALTHLTPEQVQRMRGRRRSSGGSSSSGGVGSPGANGEAAELPGLRGGVFNAFARDLPTQVTTQPQEQEQEEENTEKKEGWVNETEQALLRTLSQVLGRDERRASNAATSATEGTNETNKTDATLEAAAAWLAGGRRASKDRTNQATLPTTTAMGAQKSPATPAAAVTSTTTRTTARTARQSAAQHEGLDKMDEAVPQSLVAPYQPGRLVSLVVRAVVAQKSQVTCFGGKETVHVLPSLPPATATVQANHLLDTLNTYVESLPGGTQDVISDFLRPRSNNNSNNTLSQRGGVNSAATAKKVQEEKRRAQDALTVPGLYGDLVVAFMLSAEASQLGGVLPAAVELEQLRYRVFRLHGYRNSHDFGASIGMHQTANSTNITSSTNYGAQGETTGEGGRGGNVETANTFAQDLQRRFGPGPTAVAVAAAAAKADIIGREGDKTRRLVDAAAQLAPHFPLYRACCVSETTLQAAAAEEEEQEGVQRRRVRSQRRTTQLHAKNNAGHLLAKGNVMLCEEEKQLMRFRPLRLGEFYNELRRAARGMCAAHDTLATA